MPATRSGLRPTAYSFSPRFLKSRASTARPIAPTAASTVCGDVPRRARMSVGPRARIGFREVHGEGDIGVGALRRPEARVSYERELCRHHADHRIRLPVETHHGAKDPAVSAKAVPQVVRQDDDGRPVGPDFAPRKTSPELGLHAEQLEQVRRRHHHRNLGRVRSFASGERHELPQQTRGVLDRASGLLQFRDVGSTQPAAAQIEVRAVIAPDEVQIVRIPVRHRLDEDLLDHRIHDGEKAEPHRQGADHGDRQSRLANQTTSGELRVAAPGAAAPPRNGGPRALAQSVAQRVDKRAHPDGGEPHDPAAMQRLAGAVAVRLHHGVPHVVAEIGRVQPLQQSEPAL